MSHQLCGGVQSEFSRRLEKAEHESKWKLEQQVESLSDSSKTHLRQVRLLSGFLLPDSSMSNRKKHATIPHMLSSKRMYHHKRVLSAFLYTGIDARCW